MNEPLQVHMNEADLKAENKRLVELLGRCDYPVAYAAGQLQGIDRWLLFNLLREIRAVTTGSA